MVEGLATLGAPPKWLAADTITRSRTALESGLARETWKYSPLSRTLRKLLGAPASPVPPLRDVPDGVTIAPLSSLDPSPPFDLNVARYPLAGITASLAVDGWLIDIERSPDRPIVLASSPGINAPVMVRVHPGCAAAIEECGSASGVQAAVRLLTLAQDANVVFAHAELATNAEQWLFLQASLAENANLVLHQHATGALFRRLDTHVTLEGAGSTCTATGASVVGSGHHLDRQQVVEHLGRSTRSRTRLHNLAAGRSRCSFNGRIHIHRGACQADADLSNKNLALDVDAEINTKPELEIYTDDVRCAHGATVGQLDERALFYLKSRGVPERLARRLLSIGFLAECVTGPLAEEVLQDFLERLDGSPAEPSGSAKNEGPDR